MFLNISQLSQRVCYLAISIEGTGPVVMQVRCGGVQRILDSLTTAIAHLMQLAILVSFRMRVRVSVDVVQGWVDLANEVHGVPQHKALAENIADPRVRVCVQRSQSVGHFIKQAEVGVPLCLFRGNPIKKGVHLVVPLVSKGEVVSHNLSGPSLGIMPGVRSCSHHGVQLCQKFDSLCVCSLIWS